MTSEAARGDRGQRPTHAILMAVVLLLVPQVVPLVTTDVLEADPGGYLEHFGAAPGLLLTSWLGLESRMLPYLVVGVLVGLTAGMLIRGGRIAWISAIGLAVTSAFTAIGFANAWLA